MLIIDAVKQEKTTMSHGEFAKLIPFTWILHIAFLLSNLIGIEKSPL